MKRRTSSLVLIFCFALCVLGSCWPTCLTRHVAASATFKAGSSIPMQYPPRVQALLDFARAADAQRYQFALDKGAQIGVTADQNSYYLLWYPPNQTNAKPEQRTLIVTLHGSEGNAFNEFFLWYNTALQHGHGILALQWYFPNTAPPRDYFAPNEAYAALEPVLKQQGLRPARALLHGFSRGSANSYYVALFDRQANNNFFGLNLSNEGGASVDYPLYQDVANGKYGERVFAGMHWMTFCGGRDPNPTRDGCPAMQRTATWLQQQGATIDLVIEDQNAGHGGFHQTPRYIDNALSAFDNLLSVAKQSWTIKADSGFRINNASIPNAGLVNNEVWLTVGGQGGPKLYRSAQGDNATSAETMPGLDTALAGTNYAVGEVIPREGANGVRQLYVLGLWTGGAARAVVYRLQQNANGSFVRDPQTPIYNGANTDNEFLGVPDLYATNEGNLRLIYVARGASRQNSRTAVSNDNGKTFTFEYDNPFNDLNVATPNADNTNVDPAVLKLASGGYLAVTMRQKRLYLFGSAAGRVFTSLSQGAIEAATNWPGATGFFDPTLVQLPDGRVLLYVTLEEPGGKTSVVQATLAPAASVTNVSAANYSAGALAPASIVAAFGNGLATTTQTATALPLPTTLAGASVKVRDALGTERAAPLFFVSPTQINYLLPENTATGMATIGFSNNEVAVATTTNLINAVAPSLFSANASGQGVPAGVVLRIKADGTQSYEPLARFDAAQSRYLAEPIKLGTETDQVFLIVFGTGLRGRRDLADVNAQLGGVDAPVTFAGAQGGLAGLDQVNVRVPRSLLGRGEVDLRLAVSGQEANLLKVVIGL